MKKLYKLIFLSIISSLTIVSCDDNDDMDGLTILQEVNFVSNPDIAPSSINLSQEMQDEPAMVISWDAVKFPIEEAPVQYAVQFDTPQDTVGENGWQNAKTIQAGSQVQSMAMTVTNLNDMVKDLGLEVDKESTVVFRVSAYVDRMVYSNPVAFNVTPYQAVISNEKIYAPGTYQGWDPATAATLNGTSTNGIFEGYLSFTDPNALGFKFTTGPDWTENYGGDGNGNLVFDGENVMVPEVGTYKITVNLNNMTWMAVPSSFGIIGTATPGGWDSDTDMTYNYQEDYWEYTGDLIPGALKFRLNDQWTINYGSQNSTDFIAYLDDPGAHNIDVAGTYRITFKIDPSDASIAYYTVELQ